MFTIPKGPLHKIELFMKRLLWQEDDESNKNHFGRWSAVSQPLDQGSQPLDQGGLDIVDLLVVNVCLLSKCLWNLENGDGL